MDKSRKLRRYGRKDYTQLVDFPVEIVGRDGIVRRYSFEESVRLYQRRIASAGVRYGDQEVISAEMHHCQRRIDQLRRSYFARYGWASIRVMDSPGVFAGEFAGEVAAFLRRCIEGTETDPESLEISLLDESGQHQIYYVRQSVEQGDDGPGPSALGDERFLLYLYRFESPTGCVARDAFFNFIKVLQGVQHTGDLIESLLAFHHTADCGLILTGRPGDQALAPMEPGETRLDLGWLDEITDTKDLVREGMALLRQGDREAAVRRFIEAYEENAFRRTAYLGAAVVSDQIGAHADAETAGLMGTRYFPGDASLHYHLAVAQLRQGRVEEARANLAVADGADGDPFSVALLRALIALRSDAVRTGRRGLEAARRLASDGDYDLLQSLYAARAQLRARGALRGVGWLLVVAGLGLALSWFKGAIVLALLGGVLIPASHRAWKRQFLRLLSAPGDRGMRLANPASLKSAAESEGAVQ